MNYKNYKDEKLCITGSRDTVEVSPSCCGSHCGFSNDHRGFDRGCWSRHCLRLGSNPLGGTQKQVADHCSHSIALLSSASFLRVAHKKTTL